MSQKILSGLVAGVVSLVVALLAYQGWGEQKLGGTVENFPSKFVNGFFAGSTDQFSVDSSGNISTSGTAALSGEVKAKVITDGATTAIASGSVTLTAAQVCDSTLVTHNITYAPASRQNIRLPTAAALIADCIPDVGDAFTLIFQNTSGVGEDLDFTTQAGIDIGVASGQSEPATMRYGGRAIVRFTNIDDASVSADFLEIRGD